MTDTEVPDYHRARRTRVNGGTQTPTDGRLNVLVVTRGHPFSRDPFFAVFESNPDIEWCNIEHPAAQRAFTPEFAADFDCYVLYDMPGINFGNGGKPEYFEPPEMYRNGLMELMDQGFPLVIMHHAAAAWPAWPEWAEIVGGHFLYHPGTSRGVEVPDSGYIIDVPHIVTPVADHPITAGIEPFELVDELYLSHVFEDSITPLFVSDYDFTDQNFYSAAEALQGRMNSRGDWTHAPGSNVVGWTKTYRNSPIVYLQFGDGPSTYSNKNYRKILANAIAWAAQRPL